MMSLIPLVTADQVAFWVCAPIAVVCALIVLLALGLTAGSERGTPKAAGI